jgi:CubicO group peptidase (beta-lactamase class C family)
MTDRAAAAQVDALLQPQLDNAGLVGCAIGLVHDGELVYSLGHGFADLAGRVRVDSGTPFRIGSVGKTFTGIGVLQLRDRGLLDLDDPVTEHLRSYAWNDRPGAPPATLRHLLTHTSGVGEVRGWGDLLRVRTQLTLLAPQGAAAPDLPAYYRKGLRPEVAPGRKWAYANHGYATLGQVIEDVSGQPFAQYMREHVFDPLGMTATDFAHSARFGTPAKGYRLRRGRATELPWQQVVVAPAGSAVSSVEDLARYAAALTGGGANPAGRVLEPETLAEMTSPQWASDPRLPGMGLAYFREDFDGHRIVWHTGGLPGFVSCVMVAPEEGLGVVVLNNSGSLISFTLGESLLRAALGVPQLDHETAAPPVDPAVADRVVGVYAPEPGPLTNLRHLSLYGSELTVSVRDGRLVARGLLGPFRKGIELHPAAPDDPLLFEAVVERLGGRQRAHFAFQEDADGSVTAVAGDTFRFVRRPAWRSLRTVVPAVVGAGSAAVRRVPRTTS